MRWCGAMRVGTVALWLCLALPGAGCGMTERLTARRAEPEDLVRGPIEPGVVSRAKDDFVERAAREGFIAVVTNLPVRTGQYTQVTGWAAPPREQGDNAALRIEGLDEWKDAGYWRLTGGSLYFRARRSGPQMPEFVACYGGAGSKYRFRCNARRTRLKIVFDWDGTEQADNLARDVRTPFTIEMGGFEPPFSISAKPEKAVLITAPSRAQKLVRQGKRKGAMLIEGFLVPREFRAVDKWLVVEVADSTGAVAGVKMRIPDESDCINPPQAIRVIVKKRFHDADELFDESRRILEAVDKQAILRTVEGKDTLTLFTWIGDLRHCHSLTNRARTFFRDQATLYRKSVSGQTLSQGEVARLLEVLGQMQDNDIKNIFLKGFYKK